MDSLTLIHRATCVHLRPQVDAYAGEVRRRLRKQGTNKTRQEIAQEAWDQAWEVFKPAIEYHEQIKEDIKTMKPIDQVPQLQGMPDRTTDDILDPNYKETNPGKKLRDGLLWTVLEFDRVVQDTDEGPVVHLEDASAPPPNAFATGFLRTYALSPVDKRRELFGRALTLAEKSHDVAEDEDGEDSFLDELE